VIDLQQHPQGTILPVRAQPGARKNEIRGIQNGMLKVCVTQSPEKGKANRAIVVFLANSLNLKKSQFELFAGKASRAKQFLVHGVTRKELLARIAALLSPPR